MVQLPFSLKANRATPFSERQLFNCFEELGLERELYYKRVNEISGGQRQRMMIAVASMTNKPLIIVDEPTSGTRFGLYGKSSCLLRHQTRKGTAVLAVSRHRSSPKDATDI